MKASMYLNYPSRSLLRGGQRTLLAIFCVAVGVMAIVAMQLAGYMLQKLALLRLRQHQWRRYLGNCPKCAAQSKRPLPSSPNAKATVPFTNYTAVISSQRFIERCNSNQREWPWPCTCSRITPNLLALTPLIQTIIPLSRCPPLLLRATGKLRPCLPRIK